MHLVVVLDGRRYRTLRPVDDLARELTDAGYDVRDTRLNINPRWDHVTMTCRMARGKTQTAGEAPAVKIR